MNARITTYVPAAHEPATIDPLDVDLTLRAPLPPATLRQLPQHQILPPCLPLVEAPELLAVNSFVPRYPARRAQDPLAVRALCVRHLLVFFLLHGQRRAVAVRAVELPGPERRLAQRHAPPVEHGLGQDRAAHIWMQRSRRRAFALWIRAFDGHSVGFDLGGNVSAHAAVAERVGTSLCSELFSEFFRFHADFAIEFVWFSPCS